MNINTTPNKEVVRRICVMNGASFCYLLAEYSVESVVIFTDIPDRLITAASNELVSWCGMNFKIYNENSKSKTINNIKFKGEKILPIKME